jgi:tetratricopeptide (TPR) repeat protein
MIPDASVSTSNGAGNDLGSPNANMMGIQRGGTNTDRLFGCELRAVLTGYRSDIAALAGRQMEESRDVGTLILHRLANVQGTTISATSLHAPKDAKKAYSKGLDEAKKQKWPEAQAQFEKAVEVYPHYAAAWFELGDAFSHQNSAEQARKAYGHALESDRKFLKPYLPLAVMSLQESNWQAVAETTDALTRLDPVDYPQAFLLNAMANLNLRNYDAAEQSARQAIKLDAGHQFPRSAYVLGLILANKHDYDAALPLMREFIQRAPDAPDAGTVKKQISDIESLARSRAPQPPQ